jgi:hypothetical protein
MIQVQGLEHGVMKRNEAGILSNNFLQRFFMKWGFSFSFAISNHVKKVMMKKCR